MEEGADLQGFTSARVRLSLWEGCGDFPHYNYGTYLPEGVLDDATCQSCWRRLAAQSASSYSTISAAPVHCSPGCGVARGARLEMKF